MMAILFGFGVFLIAFAQFSKRGASHVFVKALAAGVVGWLASGLLFALGRSFIALGFIVLIITAVVIAIRKLKEDAP